MLWINWDLDIYNRQQNCSHVWEFWIVHSIQWLKKLSRCLNTFSYILNIVGNKLCNILSIFLRQVAHNTYKLSQTLCNFMKIWLHCWWFKMVIHWDSFLAFNFLFYNIYYHQTGCGSAQDVDQKDFSPPSSCFMTCKLLIII